MDGGLLPNCGEAEPFDRKTVCFVRNRAPPPSLCMQWYRFFAGTVWNTGRHSRDTVDKRGDNRSVLYPRYDGQHGVRDTQVACAVHNKDIGEGDKWKEKNRDLARDYCCFVFFYVSINNDGAQHVKHTATVARYCFFVRSRAVFRRPPPATRRAEIPTVFFFSNYRRSGQAPRPQNEKIIITLGLLFEN